MNAFIKHIITGVIFLTVSINCFAQSIFTERLNELNKTMEKASDYEKAKDAEIEALQKEALSINPNNLQRQYELSIALYNNYKVFKYDSAYKYARRGQEIAYQLKDADKIAYSSILLDFTLLSSGMFKETADSLQTFHVAQLNDSTRAEFYALKGRYYYDLADYV